MSSTPPFILHGARDFPIDAPKITLRPNGLDSVTQQFQASSQIAFAKGGAFPGLPNFYITESEPTTEIEGLAYEIRVRGEGLADGMDREEDNDYSIPDEGWDTGSISWLTLRPEQYQRGAQHPHFESLWLLEVQKKRVSGPRNSMSGLWRVSGQCKGIIAQDNGLPKARKRRITIGNQVVSSSTTLALVNQIKDGKPFPFVGRATSGPFAGQDVYTGWADQRSTALDSSRVQVSDTFITFEAPPTDQLPGHLTPENAPLVKDIFSVSWWSTAGFTWNWPWGWALKSISSEPLLYGLAGTPYLTTIVTEFVPRAVPK
jgi:hypothetical protein